MSADSKYCIGEWRFDARSNQLTRGEEAVNLEPLAAQTLEYLVMRPGEVVSTDELVEALWPRKFVGDSPVYRIIAELRRALGDDASQPEYIQTIRKRGYKLVASTSATAPVRHPITTNGSRRVGIMGLAALASVVFLAVLWHLAPTASDAPQTIAVLPFEDLSADGNDEHLGDGISEVLIHQLSQIDGLQVIARNSSFTYKGRNVDIRDVGETLGATTVLEGSVQRGDGTLRIAAQLIDAQSGNHVWSKLFDIPADDLFVVQDDIAMTVVQELLPATSEEVVEPAADDAPRLDVYELYLLGRHKMSNLETKEAVELFQQAIDGDEGFGLAFAGLADALLEGIYMDSQSLDPSQSLEDAQTAIERAIELAPDRPEPYASQLLLASLQSDTGLADRAYEEAISRDANHIDAHIRYLEDLVGRAWLELRKDYLERAIALAEQAERIDPLNKRLKRNLARIARITGAYDTADRQLRDVYNLSETRADAAQALGSLAFLYLEREYFDKAAAYFHLARRYAGDDIGVYTTYLAQSYLFMQDYASARRWLDEIEKPYDVESLFVHLDILFLAGSDELLKEEIEAHLATADGSTVPIDVMRSYAVFFLGNSGHCERLFEITALMDMEAERVRNPAGDCVLAHCYAVLGMEDKAREHIDYARDYVRRVEANGITSRIDQYVAATVFALEDERQATLDMLESAYANGLRGPDFLARDSVIGRYRDDERFQRILSGMREDVEAMRKRTFRAAQDGDWYSLVDIEPLVNLQ